MFDKAAAVAESGPMELCQDDTFFCCTNGRLKLRNFSPSEGELIFYQRPDSAGPKESFYVIAPISLPDVLRDVLRLSYGQVGRVRKRRLVFLAGRTRIHLDAVEGLGDFLELEICLSEGESTEDGVRVANELLNKLGISKEALVERAYADLLVEQNSLGGAHLRKTEASGVS